MFKVKTKTVEVPQVLDTGFLGVFVEKNFSQGKNKLIT